MVFRGLGPLVLIALAMLWVFTIAEIMRRRDGDFANGNQLLWLLLVVLLPPVGVALYWIMGAPASRRW